MNKLHVPFGDVKARFYPIFKRLDHHPLHERGRKQDKVPDSDCATLAAEILRDARAVLPEVDRVYLYETRGSGALVTLGDTSELIPV